jgi:hypothetical protein
MLPIDNPPKPGEAVCCESCKRRDLTPETGCFCLEAAQAQITRQTLSGLPVHSDAVPEFDFHDSCDMFSPQHA